MTTTVPPICTMCQHLTRDTTTGKPVRPYRCTAFPDGIPAEIKFSEVDHRQPFDGDHGIRFESANAHGDAYASMIFDHRKAPATNG